MNIIDVSILFTIGFLGALLGLLSAYALLKNKFLPMIDDVFPIAIDKIEEYVQTTDGQRTFYQIGLLIGNGAKQGIGLDAVGKNPKGLMGLVSQFAPMLFKQQGNSGNQETQINPKW